MDTKKVMSYGPKVVGTKGHAGFLKRICESLKPHWFRSTD